MGVNEKELNKLFGSLIEFNRTIFLHTTLSETPRRVVFKVKYPIINVDSLYNAILECPSLNASGTIPSTFN